MLKTQLIGYLGQEATVNTVNGKTVINFNIADTEKYKNSDGNEVEKTIWVSCAYWTDKLNVSNYLKKGTLVYVEGKPDVKTYQKDNQTIPQLTLRVSQLQLLGNNK